MFNIHFRSYIKGNEINLTVVDSPGMPLQSSPVKQYVTEKNKIAVMGETAELFCIYSGK